MYRQPQPRLAESIGTGRCHSIQQDSTLSVEERQGPSLGHGGKEVSQLSVGLHLLLATGSIAQLWKLQWSGGIGATESARV